MSSTKTEKDVFPFRAKPDTMRRIEQWYMADNCRSKNEFIEKAVNYYANALAAKDSDRLPAMVAAALDSLARRRTCTTASSLTCIKLTTTVYMISTAK